MKGEGGHRGEERGREVERSRRGGLREAEIVCVCVCVCESERVREREREGWEGGRRRRK